MFQPDATTGQPGRLGVRVNRNKEINVSKMMGSLPGCVYSRAELQSSDCLKTVKLAQCTGHARNVVTESSAILLGSEVLRRVTWEL